MYPETGFTKGQVIDYYTRVAPVAAAAPARPPADPEALSQRRRGRALLREAVPLTPPRLGAQRAGRAQLEDDPVLRLRRPGDARVARQPRRPRAAPVALEGARGRAADDHGVRPRPGRPARGSPSAARWRCSCATRSAQLGLESFPKTSGSKGIQVYVPLNVPDVDYDHGTKRLSNALARHLESQHPKLIVSSQKKELRKDRVLIDWSQNDEHKTTVGVYSLRARERPTVSTPLDVGRGRGGRSRTRSYSRRTTCWSASRSTATCSRRWRSWSRSCRSSDADNRLRSGHARCLPTTVRVRMVDWAIGAADRRACGGTGHRGGASVRRRRAVGRDGAGRGRATPASRSRRPRRRPRS